jgi:hypothetical protein
MMLQLAGRELLTEPPKAYVTLGPEFYERDVISAVLVLSTRQLPHLHMNSVGVSADAEPRVNYFADSSPSECEASAPCHVSGDHLFTARLID